MTHIRAALLTALLLAATFEASATDPSQVTLSGVMSHRACPTNAFYPYLYATLLLDASIVVEGVGRVDSVELILGERDFVSYGAKLSKRVLVTCAGITESGLCGPDTVRASCGVTRLRVAP